MRDRVGQQFGNYRLIRLLGQGGFADVYLAEHLHLGTHAAIKVLVTRLRGDEREHFRHEARTLARLIHPHIVRILDFGLEEGIPFLVMEYATSDTLRKLHPKGAVLPLETVVSYAKQVAKALQYAHDQKVIHRDIKPENMLLGHSNEVLLSDFGLAVLIESSRSQPFQETAGTVAYISPEQLQAHPVPASDQYALSIVVYEWLCGERPFSGSFPQIANQHLFVAPPSLCEKLPTIPSVVEPVVLKALAKDPSERFASVQAFALALEEATQEESFGRTLIELSTDHPTKGSFKSNLPVQLTALLGREQEVKAACTLLQRPEVRLVTLTGTGGIGKTRLGLQITDDLLNDFANGVCFVPLAPISDPELLMPTIAERFDLKETKNQSFFDLLKAYLREKHLLLLLDNFEQIVSAAPQLAELLAVCPHLKILVTSRATLRVQGEHEFPVLPLPVPNLAHLPESEALTQYAAVALFLQHAQAIKPDFQLTNANVRAIAEICTRLDGLPLAIELAAARIKLLPPQALLGRLEHRLQVLTGGAQTMPARQQTLRNTIAWSYNLLDAHEQRLFRLLSVFVGGCTIEAAEAVCGALIDGKGTGSILDDLASLIDKNLLKQTEQENGEPRLLMLETIREYALEALVVSGEKEVIQQAHADYYLNLAEEGEPHWGAPATSMWLNRLEQEHNNLRAVMQWAFERGEAKDGRRFREIALQLGFALRRFWLHHGHWSEGRNALKRALARSEGVAPLLRAQALDAAGLLAIFQDDYDQVEMLYGESLALFRKLGNKAGMAFALFGLGRAAEYRVDLVQARRLMEEALTFFREVGIKEYIGWSYMRLGVILADQGEYMRATALLAESLTIQREMGSLFGVARSLDMLVAVLFFTQGDLARIRTLAEEAHHLYKELGGPVLMPDSMVCLAYAALAEGNTARTRLLLDEALVSEREWNGGPSAWLLFLLGKVAWMQGDDALAATSYKEALVLGSRFEIPFCLEGLAGVVTRQGEPRWAAQLWGAAETLRDAMGTPIVPVWRADYDRSVAATRTHLGEQAFTAWWAEGRSMSLEQVLIAPAATTMPTPTARTPVPAPLGRKAVPSHPAGLTAREVEVLRLVAGGLTDAQVAEQLVISPRTVNTHLKAIYGKIGVSSRSAATRYAMEHKVV